MCNCSIVNLLLQNQGFVEDDKSTKNPEGNFDNNSTCDTESTDDEAGVESNIEPATFVFKNTSGSEDISPVESVHKIQSNLASVHDGKLGVSAKNDSRLGCTVDMRDDEEISDSETTSVVREVNDDSEILDESEMRGDRVLDFVERMSEFTSRQLFDVLFNMYSINIG